MQHLRKLRDIFEKHKIPAEYYQDFKRDVSDNVKWLEDALYEYLTEEEIGYEEEW